MLEKQKRIKKLDGGLGEGSKKGGMSPSSLMRSNASSSSINRAWTESFTPSSSIISTSRFPSTSKSPT